MDRYLRVHGGFRLSARLAAEVHDAVVEITRRTFGRDLSHPGDHCPLCAEERAAAGGSGVEPASVPRHGDTPIRSGK